MKPVRIALIGELPSAPDGELTGSDALITALAALPDTEVTVRAVVADEREASYVADVLRARGNVHPCITGREAAEAPGPIRRGDTLDIWGLFAHDVVILDFADPGLRHFLTDLPAHTKPDVRLLGTLRTVSAPQPLAIREVALRCDTLVGSDLQFQHLMDASDGDSALTEIHTHLRGVNLRAAVMIGPHNAIQIAALDEAIWTTERTPQITVPHAIAHVATGMARRERWSTIGKALSHGNDDD